MGESSNVVDQTIKKKGYFGFSSLYEFCFNWFKDQGYKLSEDEYMEKEDGGAKEIKIKWTIKKKVSDYFQNKVVLKWHILQLKDAEIERGGKMEKTNKGDLKIVVTADLVSDYAGRWEDRPFNKFIRGLYDKYIIKTTADEYEDRLEDKAKKFISDAKAFLELSDK
jgi:hypothetical protein